MKKNKKFTLLHCLLMIISLVIISSCDNNEGTSGINVLPELNSGGFIRFPDGQIPPSSVSYEAPTTAAFIMPIEDLIGNASSYSLDLTASTAGETFVIEDYITIDTFPNTLNISISDIADALGLTLDDINFGDSFSFIATVINDEGNEFIGSPPSFDDETKEIGSGNTVSGLLTNTANYNNAMDFSFILACPETNEPIDILPGDWVINMFDAFGDGWQPTTADGGGPGIVLTLSNGTVYEIGLCTTYEDPGYNCSDGSGAGTRIINIPAGITDFDWEWEFKGDFWGEMSFEIRTPNGNFAGSGSPGMDPGIIQLNLCNQ